MEYPWTEFFISNLIDLCGYRAYCINHFFNYCYAAATMENGERTDIVLFT